MLLQIAQNDKQLEFKKRQQILITHNLNNFVAPSTDSKVTFFCKVKVIFM
jgi:hypothetical protein